MSALSEYKLDAFRGKNIGIIFQQSHLIKSLNVEENLEAAQYLSGEKQNTDKVKTILERLNLGAKLKAKPSKLSQGEQQRVAIARALVNSPQLILADEPTSSLDDINCTEVVNLLLEQSKESGATLIIVTHDGRLKSMFENKIELTKKY
jgi:putative ABC transport system ATP-binding protein